MISFSESFKNNLNLSAECTKNEVKQAWGAKTLKFSSSIIIFMIMTMIIIDIDINIIIIIVFFWRLWCISVHLILRTQWIVVEHIFYKIVIIVIVVIIINIFFGITLIAYLFLNKWHDYCSGFCLLFNHSYCWLMFQCLSWWWWCWII